MRSSSSPQICVWCPWRLASKMSSAHWFSSRTRSTTSAKVRLLVIGARSRSTRGPLLCWVASRVWEVIWSLSATAMSRRCSHVAIWRVLALSTTLTSLVPWNPTPPVYLSKEGSNTVAASRSTGLRLEEPQAWLARWYSTIMQSTWFPSIRVSHSNTSRWRCVIPRVAT